MSKKNFLDQSCFEGLFKKKTEELLKELKKIPDLKSKNWNGTNLLHLAVLFGHTFEVIKYLVDKEVGINARDEYDSTPLHGVCLFNDIVSHEICNKYEVMSYLVKKGADINAQDMHGKTPLHLSCQFQKVELIEFLIEKGADLTAKDDSGATPLHSACLSHDGFKLYKLVELSIEKNIDLRAQDHGGNNILHLVCSSKYPHREARPYKVELIKYLIKKGVDYDKPNKDNKTALDLLEINNKSAWEEVLVFTKDVGEIGANEDNFEFIISNNRYEDEGFGTTDYSGKTDGDTENI